VSWKQTDLLATAPMIHTLDKVPRRFNEGPFWGNASLGALLYCEGDKFRIALDHVGLWEMRDAREGPPYLTFKEARALGQPDFDFTSPKVVEPDKGPCRVRLPGLTLFLQASASITKFLAETDLATARTNIEWSDANGNSGRLNVWLHASEDFLFLQEEPGSWPLLAELSGWDFETPDLFPLKLWGYPRAVASESRGVLELSQPFSGDQVAVASLLDAPGTRILTLSTGSLAEGGEIRARMEAGLKNAAGRVDDLLASHTKEWSDFWSRFSVSLPEPILQQGLELELYKLFCNARPQGLPMTLQGIWNHDQAMPAWTGDWHNDLNLQACYWSAFKTNHIDLARPYIELFSQCLPHFEKRSREYFEIEGGTSVPTLMGPGGHAAGTAWTSWSMLLGPELFAGIDFCWLQDYQPEEERLRGTIYPFLQKVARLYEGVAELRADGRRHIPFAHSPELYSPDHSMWLVDDTTFMVSSLRYILQRLESYATALGLPGEASRWRAFHESLVDTPTGENGFPIWPGHDLDESHRHFSHLFPVFPLGATDRLREEDDRLVQRSLDRLADLGSTAYAGFSFPYRAILSARGGRGDAARLNLYQYLLGLRSPNSFCVNGDAYRTGVIFSSETSAGQPNDVFTLEAGLIVPAAISEMFVHRSGDTIWLAPALPLDWREASIRGATVEGGHRVDLEIRDHQIARALIHPVTRETVRVTSPAWASRYSIKQGAGEKDVKQPAVMSVILDPSVGSWDAKAL